MFISQIINTTFFDSNFKKSSQDFINYCNDLHKIFGAYLNEDILSSDHAYSYSELLDYYIQSDARVLPLMQAADCCIIVYSAYDYDPVHSDPGAYLMDRYQIKCEMFDVIEQERLCVVTALHLLSLFFQSKKYNRAIIIGLEQTSLPLRTSAIQQIPKFSGVGLIVLSSICMCAHLKFLHSDIFSDLNHAVLWISESLIQYSSFVYYHIISTTIVSHEKLPLLKNSKILFHSIPYGILPLFYFLHDLQQIAPNNHTAIYAVLIHDEELQEWGVLLFESA